MAIAAMAAGPIIAGYKTGKAEVTSGKAAQKLYRYNAAVEDANAKELERTGRYEARAKRQEIERILATQRVLTGAAGLTMSGTPTTVAVNTATEGELDALMISRNYNVEASQHRAQAKILRWQGRTEMMLARRRANAMYINMVGTGLMAAGKTNSYGQNASLLNTGNSASSKNANRPNSYGRDYSGGNYSGRGYKMSYPG